MLRLYKTIFIFSTSVPNKPSGQKLPIRHKYKQSLFRQVLMLVMVLGSTFTPSKHSHQKLVVKGSKYKQSLFRQSLILVMVWGSIMALIWPFGSAQAITKPLKAPDTLEQAKTFIVKVLKALPEGISNACQEAKQIWQNTWISWWGTYIKPLILKVQNWIEGLWQKLLKFLGKEIKQRTPIIEQELEKEKQEAKQDIGKLKGKIKQGIWEGLKELIKIK